MANTKIKKVYDLFENSSLIASLNNLGLVIMNNLSNWLFIILSVLIMRFSLLHFNLIAENQANLFTVAITYTFIFVQIIVNLSQMIYSRYLADQLFEKKSKTMFATMVAILGINLVLTLILFLVYLSFSNLDAIYNILVLTLMLQVMFYLSIQPIISSLKLNVKLAIILCFAMFLAISLAFIFLMFKDYLFNLSDAYYPLFAFIIGLMVINIYAVVKMSEMLEVGDQKHCFDFLLTFDKYPNLRFVSLVFTLGLWIPNLIYWFNQDSIEIYNTFRVNIVYDTSVFIGYLVIIPTYTHLYLSIENKVYPVFKKFLTVVNQGGTVEMIKNTKEYLNEVVINEVEKIFRLQGLITSIIVIVIWVYSSQSMFYSLNSSILQLTIIGTTINGFILVILLFTLYFDAKKEAKKISLVFFLSNTISALLCYIIFKEHGYGINLIIAGLITFIYSINMYYDYTHEIDNRLFLYDQRVEKYSIMSKLYYSYQKLFKNE